MDILTLFHSTTTLPKASAMQDAERNARAFLHHAEQMGQPALADFARAISTDKTGQQLLYAIFGNSPYLTRLVTHWLKVFHDLCSQGIEPVWAELQLQWEELLPAAQDERALMQRLRQLKAQAALLIAVADITQQWDLEKVTGALTLVAEKSLVAVVNFLLHRAHQKKEIALPHPREPARDSGFIVLGMGKLGGHELNYSSDIDLIILFDREKIRYTGTQTLQHGMNRLALDIVRLMQERTADGYVFRTDLRLRPDPASTPPAMSVGGAITYYETVGQNWERAALIKARPVAGDMVTGTEFLTSIAPFIWRKYLDFASITDIHSIKRQMNTRTGSEIALAGHNIKLGVGGIREIEFFAQVHQLIWGGRNPALRTIGTCETLRALHKHKIITATTQTKLVAAYRFYRRVEHHLQMIADQQTHTLPQTPEELEKLSIFLGYDRLEDFSRELLSHLATVHKIFAGSLKEGETLGAGGNLVFTGVDNDPETLKTIGTLGYKNPATVSEVIQGWHRGSRRATRTKRAREMITELTPALLKALASTANPDAAFIKFDEFLAKLPAGVQLFSLFANNPHLLGLIATIMGSAPAMAGNLSKNPALLDTVLTVNFYDPLPPRESLTQELSAILVHARDFEEAMDMLRRFKNEKHFQVGVQILTGRLAAGAAGGFLTDIADITVSEAHQWVEREFARQYGHMKGGAFAVVALGKLGAREMTFGSDIDLVFVYHTPGEQELSDGEKELNASVYYNRLAQRFISALTALTREGELYETDTRLRPSGKDGPLAVSIEAFDKYFAESAWTFELMALTRARQVAGTQSIMFQIDTLVRRHVLQPRDATRIATDVLDIREKIAKEFGTDNLWNVKYVRGGMMDFDFLAQALVLRYAHKHPDIFKAAALEVFAQAGRAGVISPDEAETLMACGRSLTAMLTLLRLLSEGTLEEQKATPGLIQVLCAHMHEQDMASLKSSLVKTEQTVYAYFQSLIKVER